MTEEPELPEPEFAPVEEPPAAVTPADEYLNHITDCGHCKSFPTGLCEEGLRLLKKAMDV